ncbi:hypothetical protein BUZ94_03850 [Mammaliicoccus sciuri]|uniref:lipopolysaccharide biosynthesis protein n=1 Tax=Mammaliicoccus sciuri TaxID=1296 RepID=UPI000E6A0CB8|nr:hypothetical protein [Mammaliicoccus sciuri]RIO10857.1 hypothetical protein BUZ94_03850 [Mammaliicoccus sciuri]
MKKFSNIGYTFIGNLVVAFSKWLLLILIVRISSPNEVGSYTFAIALTTPLVLFINMRLRLRYVVEDDLEFKLIKNIRVFLNYICIIFISIFSYIYYEEYFLFIIIIAFSKLLDLNSELYYAVLHKIEKYKNISILMISKAIIIIIIFSIVLFFTNSVLMSLISQLIIQIIFLFFIEKRNEKYVSMHLNIYSWKIYLKILLIGLPLGFVQLLNSYNILLPRYIIEQKLTVQLVGVFAAISYLLTIVDLFMNSLSQNIILSIKSKLEDKQYQSLINFLRYKVSLISILIGCLLTAFIYLFGSNILAIIYGDDYIKYNSVFTIISISFIFNFQSWMFDTTIMALKMYKIQMISSIITLIISSIISYYLIINYELVGASISIVLITLVQCYIKRLIVINKINKLKRSFI